MYPWTPIFFVCLACSFLVIELALSDLLIFTVILWPISPCLDGFFFLAFCRSWTGRFKTFVFTWKVEIPNMPFFVHSFPRTPKKEGFCLFSCSRLSAQSSWCESYFVEHRQLMTFRKQFRWEVWERTRAIAKIFAEDCNRFCRSWLIFVTPIP